MTDYIKATAAGLTTKPRWEEGIPHHPNSIRLYNFIEEHDYKDMNDALGLKSGGDGDNGEFLRYEMDAFFELMDLLDAG